MGFTSGRPRHQLFSLPRQRSLDHPIRTGLRGQA